MLLELIRTVYREEASKSREIIMNNKEIQIITTEKISKNQPKIYLLSNYKYTEVTNKQTNQHTQSIKKKSQKIVFDNKMVANNHSNPNSPTTN